jgi:hypothetical protein
MCPRTIALIAGSVRAIADGPQRLRRAPLDDRICVGQRRNKRRPRRRIPDETERKRRHLTDLELLIGQELRHGSTASRKPARPPARAPPAAGRAPRRHREGGSGRTAEEARRWRSRRCGGYQKRRAREDLDRGVSADLRDAGIHPSLSSHATTGGADRATESLPAALSSVGTQPWPTKNMTTTKHTNTYIFVSCASYSS